MLYEKVLSSITLVTLSTLLIAGYASPAFADHAANQIVLQQI